VILNRSELEELLQTRLPPGVEGISGVTHDSRAAGPGDAFVAVSGFKRDGAEFAPEAVRRGAVLVVAERELTGLPVVVVRDAREALARLAAAVCGHPSHRIPVYGITGTNGKTTTSYALHAVFSGAGPCGLLSTAEIIVGRERRPALRTTPEAPEVQSALDGMLRAGMERVVMEVSSHGVELKRVAHTRFAGALFTNLSRDHLDLHPTMEHYYRAKRRLLEWAEGPKLSNADDEWGLRLAGEVEGVLTFGRTPRADYRIEGVEDGGAGMRFRLRHPEGVLELESPLLGDYNVSNVAGAAALALAAGIPEETVVRAVREMPQIPGRFERIGCGQDFEVVVDYAHTDVGLAAVLEVARALAGRSGGRVICVFGAAGERDKAKRPKMGAVSTRLADWSVVTTDDAYSEDPGEIARQVAAGAAPGRYEVILDRLEAIRRALRLARRGDVVVVAGKGHERVQHLPEGDVPFHDASAIRALLRQDGEVEVARRSG
jgi:UDP-N-acetylmuramoyl-L-alanyl-D-glutamate--2,6-diaminopimelate ligase